MGRTKLGGELLPRDAEVRCIACGDSIYFLPDSYPLAFHCENGHFLTVQDLLEEYLPAEKTPQPCALEYWESKSRLLQELARRALSGGYALIAADFQETAGRIDGWGKNLQKLLAGNPGPVGHSERVPKKAGP
jgi:hypothetical protein